METSEDPRASGTSAGVEPPKQRQSSATPKFEGIQQAKIILGFTAIGKTHLAARANREFEWLHVIDYSFITHEVEFTPEYRREYLSTIVDAAQQPGVLLLGGRGWVGEFLVANNLAFSSVYPNYNAIKEYRLRWGEMGEDERFIAHRLTWWDDMLAAMKWPNSRCIHYELDATQYLEDVFLRILTVADKPQQDQTYQNRTLLPQNAEVHERITKRSYVLSVLNYILLILQFAFLLLLGISIFLAYQEHEIWRIEYEQLRLQTMDDFITTQGLSTEHRFDSWLFPKFLQSLLESLLPIQMWLGTDSRNMAGQELMKLVQSWLDAERMRIRMRI